MVNRFKERQRSDNSEAALEAGSPEESKVRILNAICLEKTAAERQMFLSLVLLKDTSAALMCHRVRGPVQGGTAVLPILVTSTWAQGRKL